MRKELFIIPLLAPVFLISCGPQNGGEEAQAQEKEAEKKEAARDRAGKKAEQEGGSEKPRSAPLALEKGKIYEKNGRKYLWGGEDSSTHFDITNCSLKDSNFHFGLGREKFEALVEPEYMALEQADEKYSDSTDFLATRIKEEAKAYPLKLLRRHEVVNDRIGGVPVFAAYCHLADLAAMYPRVIENDTLTFALSGYTYYEEDVWDGTDAFVLWDRETESLWWPIKKKAVSGDKKGTALEVYDDSKWEQLSWKGVKEKYPKAQILKAGQTYDESKRD